MAGTPYEPAVNEKPFTLLLVSEFEAAKLDELVPQWRDVLNRKLVEHLVSTGWTPPAHVLTEYL